jgi:hypothetical protein
LLYLNDSIPPTRCVLYAGVLKTRSLCICYSDLVSFLAFAFLRSRLMEDRNRQQADRRDKELRVFDCEADSNAFVSLCQPKDPVPFRPSEIQRIKGSQDHRSPEGGTFLSKDLGKGFRSVELLPVTRASALTSENNNASGAANQRSGQPGSPHKVATAA